VREPGDALFGGEGFGLHAASGAQGLLSLRPAVPRCCTWTRTWKFRAMYEMRERMAAQSGMKLIVHQNPEALAKGINPFDHGSQGTPTCGRRRA